MMRSPHTPASSRAITGQKLVLGLALLSCLFSLSAALMAPPDADAQRGRRGRAGRRSAATQPDEAPLSAGIADALGDVHWGMHPRELFEQFQTQIEERFRPQIAKAPGAIEEDRLRAQMQEEIRRLRSTFTRFRGQATGWDSSFLRDEYTHGNREAMLVYRDTNSQNFYFFIQDRLWKWYKAFDASVFAGQSFQQFAGAVQTRFGRAVERTGALVEGRPPSHWLEWQDATTRLRAIDHTTFYGFYCLVFEDKATLAQLPTLRTATQARDDDGHAMVESILRGEGEASQEGGSGGGDSHADIVDRLTGQIRRRTDAPESGSGSSSGSTSSSGSSDTSRSGSSSSSSSSSSSGSRSRPDDDDPFAGMDL